MSDHNKNADDKFKELLENGKVAAKQLMKS